MTISRRAFLASASAFSIMQGLASAAGDKRIFAPNGGWVPGIYGLSPAQMWEVYAELYCYSSEMYAK